MLKRLLLAASACAYLALVGLQAAHVHRDSLESRPDSCAVCATAQTVGEAANAAPVLAKTTTCAPVVVRLDGSCAEPSLREASARAPPAAA